jgi:biotin carboxyl carrier protein
MSLLVEIGDDPLKIELDEADGRLWAVWGEDERRPVALHRHPNSDLYTLEIGQQRATLWMARRDGKLRIHWNGRTHEVTVQSARVHALRRRLREEGPGTGSDVPVEAVMPGVVTKILVDEGQTVTEEDGLLVVDAMKMENEIRAPASGIIGELSVEAGQEVKRGQTLCVIQPAQTAENGGEADGDA